MLANRGKVWAPQGQIKDDHRQKLPKPFKNNTLRIG
jgi:hypothetical protein